MELKQLRAFLTVAETGNVTRAAEALHIVQPAVSRQLMQLEEDLGVELFRRERHGMVLTDAGEELVGYARRALLELERARAQIGAANGEVAGVVTVGLLPSTIDVLAQPLVEAVSARFPNIQLRVSMGYAGTMLKWLASGEVDVALLYGAEGNPDVLRTPLVEEPLWVIGPPDAQLHRKRAVPLRELAKHPVVLPSAPHGLRTLIEHACAVEKVQLDVRVESNALSVQRRLVMAGMGWTVLPPIAVADDLTAGRLSGKELASPTIKRKVVLGSSAQRPLPRQGKAVMETLLGVARTAVEQGDWLEATWLGK